MLSYSLPETADAVDEEMTDAIQPQITEAPDLLTKEYGESIDAITTDMEPYDYCRDQKYETYVLLTVLRRSFVRAHLDS